MTPTDAGVGSAPLGAVPPVAVSGLTLLGLPLQDWVYMLTIAYTSMQICWFIWKRIRGRVNEA